MLSLQDFCVAPPSVAYSRFLHHQPQSSLRHLCAFINLSIIYLLILIPALLFQARFHLITWLSSPPGGLLTRWPLTTLSGPWPTGQVFYNSMFCETPPAGGLCPFSRIIRLQFWAWWKLIRSHYSTGNLFKEAWLLELSTHAGLSSSCPAWNQASQVIFVQKHSQKPDTLLVWCSVGSQRERKCESVMWWAEDENVKHNWSQ